MSAINIAIPNEAAMQRFAAALAVACTQGSCILLSGDLGAGKTSFARGFLAALQATPEEVLSPSFMLVQTYPGKAGYMLWHFDLYRLKSAHELREIGLEDALQSGITLIEWPEVAEGELPEDALSIAIGFGESPSERVLQCSFTDSAWQEPLTRAQHILQEKAA